MASLAPAESMVIQRIRAEYVEMPGLKLTPAQAQRLWNLNRAACDGALGELVESHFLFKTDDGVFVRADAGGH